MSIFDGNSLALMGAAIAALAGIGSAMGTMKFWRWSSFC